MDTVKKLCILSLHKIAGHDTAARDYLLGENLLPILLRELDNKPTPEIKRAIVHAVYKLCDGTPAPCLEQILPVIPVLRKLLTSQDPQSLRHNSARSCRIVGTLVLRDSFPESLAIEFCQLIVNLLETQYYSNIVRAALNVISRLAAGNHKQTEIVIRCGGIRITNRLLDRCSKSKLIKQEACAAFSNILCGSTEQIEQMFEEGAIASLISLMNDESPLVRKEAVQAIANLMRHATLSQIQRVVEMGGISAMCNLLKDPHVMILRISLEGISSFVKQGEALRDSMEDENPHIVLIKEGDFYEMLMQVCNDPEIRAWRENEGIRIL